MTDTTISTSQRWLSLLVRYWAANMTKIHNRGSNWPGFRYTDDEKAELGALASQVSQDEFYWFTGVTSVIAIALFAVVVTAGMYLLLWAIGGEQNMPQTPASLFFLSLALQVIVCLTTGLPAAMLMSAVLVGRWHGVPNSALPEPATTARYFHKLIFQITRMTLVMTALVLPLWIYVPADSKFMAVIRLVVPLLSPVVSVLTTVFYFSSRQQRTLSSGRP
jgi:hypothetical protein